MTTYTLTDNPNEVIMTDHPFVPCRSTIVPESRYWCGDGLIECYQSFLDGGGTPEPIPGPTLEQQQRELAAARDEALNAMVHDFGGRVIQVRLKDLANVQLRIEEGVDKEWYMADNTVAIITIAELQEAMASGIAQGNAIWDQFFIDIQALQP